MFRFQVIQLKHTLVSYAFSIKGLMLTHTAHHCKILLQLKSQLPNIYELLKLRYKWSRRLYEILIQRLNLEERRTRITKH